MANIFLLTGSNLGEREKYLHQARVFIQEKIGIILNTSSIYKTEPWGNTEQQDFLNQVLEVQTVLEPEELLQHILTIEQEIGRERTEKWGPRVIDIDILFYDDKVMQSQRLTIPHPLLHERRFTLLPLVEIAPDVIHPVILKSVQQLLEECSDTSIVNIYSS